MGIFSSLVAHRSAVLSAHPRDPVIAEWFGGGSSASGLAVNADTAMRVTAVNRSVSILAQTYASLPLGVYRQLDNGGKERDRSHPLDAVLTRRPNRWQTSFEWREMMEAHFCLRGACYSEIVSSTSAFAVRATQRS